ncbi:hypothetical protein ABZ858_08765 [Streptomyces sp. NPDC047017]
MVMIIVHSGRLGQRLRETDVTGALGVLGVTEVLSVTGVLDMTGRE